MSERRFVCGTRAVVRLKGTRGFPWGAYVVVCATCGGGGTRRFVNKDEAISAAVRASAQPCRCKGCGAS